MELTVGLHYAGLLPPPRPVWQPHGLKPYRIAPARLSCVLQLTKLHIMPSSLSLLSTSSFGLLNLQKTYNYQTKFRLIGDLWHLFVCDI